ncbi:MAG: DegV family protein, partial [Candidatus Heimdallarchaeaceae archaeon]
YECGLSSASHGALVLHTNKLLKKGKTTSEIIDILGKIRKQVFTIGISPSFDVLFKTGKIQKKMSINILSKVLKLKPMYEIVLNEGAQGFGAGLGYESAIKKAVQRLKELTLEDQEYYLILSDANNTKYFRKVEEEIGKIVRIKDTLYWKIPPVVMLSTGAKSFQITLAPYIG